MATTRGRSPAPARLAGALLALAIGIGALAGCSSDPPTPAEQRRQRVEHRLNATFSRAQTRCILAALDATTIAALARDGSLPAGSLQLARYSDAVAACVNEAGTTTTTAPTTTTTAGSSTTAASGGD